MILAAWIFCHTNKPAEALRRPTSGHYEIRAHTFTFFKGSKGMTTLSASSVRATEAEQLHRAAYRQFRNWEAEQGALSTVNCWTCLSTGC